MLVWVCVYCGCAYVLCEKAQIMSDREWMVAQQERVRKGKSWEKRKDEEKKGEKWSEGKECLFAFV